MNSICCGIVYYGLLILWFIVHYYQRKCNYWLQPICAQTGSLRLEFSLQHLINLILTLPSRHRNLHHQRYLISSPRLLPLQIMVSKGHGCRGWVRSSNPTNQYSSPMEKRLTYVNITTARRSINMLSGAINF